MLEIAQSFLKTSCKTCSTRRWGTCLILFASSNKACSNICLILISESTLALFSADCISSLLHFFLGSLQSPLGPYLGLLFFYRGLLFFYWGLVLFHLGLLLFLGIPHRPSST